MDPCVVVGAVSLTMRLNAGPNARGGYAWIMALPAAPPGRAGSILGAWGRGERKGEECRGRGRDGEGWRGIERKGEEWRGVGLGYK